MLDHEEGGGRELTRLELAIDRAAHRILAGKPESGARAAAIECAVFVLKQAWACIFGALRLGAVPLFSGFMYAAVGSYMVRVYRLHDLRFTRYPAIWATTVVAAGIYVNFFTHHFVLDLRWILLALVVLLWGRVIMRFRVWRTTLRVPLLAVFAGVALFIWLAENIATWAGAWLYPHQQAGWELVSPQKFVSWFLLMIVSVVMVTWVYPPRPADDRQGPDRDLPSQRIR